MKPNEKQYNLFPYCNQNHSGALLLQSPYVLYISSELNDVYKYRFVATDIGSKPLLALYLTPQEKVKMRDERFRSIER